MGVAILKKENNAMKGLSHVSITCDSLAFLLCGGVMNTFAFH